MQNNDTRETNHVRFYFYQTELYEKCLNSEQMGRLFFAVAKYARTGERQDVDADIRYPYEESCARIDKQNGVYKF